MKSPEERLKVMEQMIVEIYNVMVMGQTPPPPGVSEYRRAIEAMVRGDKEPLAAYLRKGGQVLKAETIYPTADMQRGRKSVRSVSTSARRRREKATSGPVMLPETKGQRRMVQ